MAQEAAKVSPDSITYIEAHGTATKLGDPIEVQALTEAFGRSDSSYCALGSVKSNVGHLDAAAGIAGLIKTALCLKHRELAKYFDQPLHLGLLRCLFMPLSARWRVHTATCMF